MVQNPGAQLGVGLLHRAAEAEDGEPVPLMTMCRLAVRSPSVRRHLGDIYPPNATCSVKRGTCSAFPPSSAGNVSSVHNR
jgi:hypothetical protein